MAGHDVVSERDDVRRNIGLVFQDPTLDGYLTAEQNLRAPRRALRRRVGARRAAHAAGAGDGRPVGARGSEVAHLLRRHAPPPGDRPRADALAAGAVPRRADDRPRPADARARSGATSASSRQREEITIFMTTHYMDEAEWCDRIAIMDNGQIVALDTPEALKAAVGKPTGSGSRPTTTTRRSPRSQEQFGIEATVAEGAVTFGVAEGEEFVPRLFAELGVPIRRSACRGRRSTTSSCPTPARRSATPRRTRRSRNRAMMQMMGGARPMSERPRPPRPAPPDRRRHGRRARVADRPRPRSQAQLRLRAPRDQDRLAPRADPLLQRPDADRHRAGPAAPVPLRPRLGPAARSRAPAPTAST